MEAALRIAAGTIAGSGAALLMVGLLAAIAVTGRWPIDAPRTHMETNGVLPAAPAQVSAVEMTGVDGHADLRRSPAGRWRIGEADLEQAAAEHIETALRLLQAAAPRRVLSASEYRQPDLVQYGLDPPRLSVAVTTGANRRIIVAFGSETPGQNAQYARLQGEPNLYLLSRDVGEEWQLALDMVQRGTAANGPVASEASHPMPLLPVSIAQIWAIELVSGGTMYRFERDPAGNWFHHVGQHVHTPGGFVHHADPKLAALIAAELDALDRATIERVVERHPDPAILRGFGLEHPPSLMLLYARDSTGPVARIAFGKSSEDGRYRYAAVGDRDAVVTVPGNDVAHIGKLLEFTRGQS